MARGDKRIALANILRPSTDMVGVQRQQERAIDQAKPRSSCCCQRCDLFTSRHSAILGPCNWLRVNQVTLILHNVYNKSFAVALSVLSAKLELEERNKFWWDKLGPSAPIYRFFP
ncbi:hypothetical protein BDN70DRAFT_117483 [Pholiota conissans]|uniref:Uncharacterized protein n=1 Tax=Pholiota conissans TaxID=109636 RepID=A0A9P5YXC2_9AGAR|nr:hypothetical protein BDN70DRAFT_117483 [Pholiota conissans]